MKRRIFIKNSSALGASLFTIPFLSRTFSEKPKLNVLVLGGTNFVGPAVVKGLIEKGHQVTLFNRGITNPHLFPRIRKIKGDRTLGPSGYENLLDLQSTWDAVIDVWPQNPRMVEEAIAVLKHKTDHYLFVSSIAVYADYKSIGINENAPIRTSQGYEEGNYNANKVLCERVVEKYFPDSFTTLRPGAIIGERDPGPFSSDLINRMINRQEILAPDANDPVQFIDVKDLGQYITLCLENRVVGYFNVIGPRKRLGYKDMLLKIRKSIKSDTKILWIDPDFLLNRMQLEPFIDIPFWIPLKTDPEPGFYQISHMKAIQKGLQFSDFGDTIQSAYNSFVNKRFIEEANPFGISEEREDEIIALWKEAGN
ncbi:NAD-dependent epimerase/dehydratase family protein [Fulvivirgaceae bacterium BMA12]|uniref:NAD-dependent epimerase/dehydratase family protein n=1 Tax=Agaribacillus aureus TaxID=3051825 RepID=A0ABT8L5L9_9BACT|nr:NAD-dependent epimerase/dehydratase family protein [Fulvivirgaceae bacterium BMA12]